MPGFRRFSPACLAVNAALAVVYYFAAQLGLSLAFVNASATAFWPCTGLAIAAILLFGPRVSPGIFLGAFFINYSVDRHIPVALGIALGNSLEALIASFATRRWAAGEDAFEHPHDVFRFVGIVAAAAALSAALGVTALFFAGLTDAASAGSVWRTWWLGDFVSALVVAPFLVTWTRGRSQWKDVPGVVLCVAVAAVLAQVVFGGWFPGVFKGYPLEYFCIPFVIWTAFAYTQRGAQSAVFVMSWLAVQGTLKGYGPFAMGGHPHESLILLQTFMGTLALVALVFAALVTETARTRAQLVTHLEDLKRSNVELEQFAHVASHDLQEPMRKIINYGERLETRSAALTEADRDALERMRASAMRMKALLEDLLRYSGISRAAEMERVELKTVVDEVLSDLELKVAQSHATVHIETRLPAVWGNRTQMRHLVQNLISNALKFHRPGEAPVIKIAARELGEFVEFLVADEGIGFDEKYVKKMFEPFQRLHPRGEYEGNGIGLSIVRKIVENHGGTITAKSAEGRGATFVVTLPSGTVGRRE